MYLSDDVLALLRSGQFNSRLLCAIVSHPAFRRFLTDAEIVVDRIADMRVHDMNAIMEATRQEVLSQYAPSEDDLHLRTLELAQVQESDFFNHILYDDMNSIICDLREKHRNDQMTADEPPKFTDVQQRFMNAVSHGGGEAAMIHMFCDQMAIPYDKLTSEEFNVFMRILGKSAHLKNSASKRGKGAAQRKK